MRFSTTIGSNIDTAADHLRSGELVAIPTETVYGLAGNALDRSCVVKIFEAKDRPAFDPLIVHVGNLADVAKYAHVDDRILQWIDRLSPGPITYILPKKEIIPDLVTSGHATVGIRIPDHSLTLELLRSLDFPLAAPSANPFGYVSPTRASHVQDQLNGKLPYILDGGPCRVGIESTIIDLSGDHPTVLRLGGYDLSELEEKMGVQLTDIRLSSSQPNAPGMLHSHYAPGVKLVEYGGKIDRELSDLSRVGAIRFKDVDPRIPSLNQIILSESGDLNEAASQLFVSLRKLDQLDIDIALVEFVPEEGLGRAINDRLTRATARP